MQSQITVRLDEEFKEQIPNIAKRLRRKRSDIVRLALEKFISEIDGLNESKPYMKWGTTVNIQTKYLST